MVQLRNRWTKLRRDKTLVGSSWRRQATQPMGRLFFRIDGQRTNSGTAFSLYINSTRVALLARLSKFFSAGAIQTLKESTTLVKPSTPWTHINNICRAANNYEKVFAFVHRKLYFRLSDGVFVEGNYIIGHPRYAPHHRPRQCGYPRSAT